jgi:SAM-dependent methyltransferase
MFRADPHRTDEPALDVLRSLVQPGETWLDIGAGGGRYALPIALLAREVIALDPSPGMLDILRGGMKEHSISNVRIVESRWPATDGPTADVAMIAHVSYDIAPIGEFLDAMEAAARRLCIAILLWRQPAAVTAPLWPAVHGEPRAALPALPEFLALQLARGRLCEVRLAGRMPPSYASVDDALHFARRQLWVEPGSEKDAALQSALRDLLTERDGRFAIDWSPLPVGIVTWEPPAATG